MSAPVARPPQISASILNADFAALGDEVERAARGGVDSIHLDVMDGHFVPNLTMGPVVVEADDEPREVIERIHRTGRAAGLAINPETPAEAAHPYLEEIDLLLVMTVHPGFGGQAFIADVLPKLSALRAEADRRSLDLPIAVDGGVNEETIESAHAAGGDVLVVGSGLYRHTGELRDVIDDLRAMARGSSDHRASRTEASA